MADKSFGVKQVNLIGASGTPTITSPNNLNLNAVTVAISTDISVGGNLSVTGIITSTSGITTFYGDASNLISGRWTLGASGSSHYTFTGIGFTQTTNDPNLYLTRGRVYEFVNNSGGSHPFQIRVSNAGAAYNVGVTNNGAATGTIKFEVPFSAPSTLYYQCTNHAGMGSTIYVLDETFPVNSNAYGIRTVQSGGSPSGGNDGDIYYIY